MGLLKIVGIMGVTVAAVALWAWLNDESRAELPTELSDATKQLRQDMYERWQSRKQTDDMVDSMNASAQKLYDKRVIHDTAVELWDNELIDASGLDDVVGRDLAGWIWGGLKMINPVLFLVSQGGADAIEAKTWDTMRETNASRDVTGVSR